MFWGFVFEDGGDGGVVEGALTGGVRPGGHEEGGIWEVEFGLEKDIGGLTRGDEKCVGIERFDINSIDIDDGESVVGDTEKELVIQCSVDYAEKVVFFGLNL